MYYPLISIALGSILGAWLRWLIGLKLNPIFPAIPLGTVTVNFIGGFIIGFAISYFSQSALSPNHCIIATRQTELCCCCDCYSRDWFTRLYFDWHELASVVECCVVRERTYEWILNYLLC